ncbi:MAG TPA: hypothetical protein VMQ17_22860 [Candidatus Sulfotelmatobacter sp.]|nr:hypothetical protein [Candidatus Sulfotelmatobacter sp.]
MSEIEDLSGLIGKPSESVPVVDAADLKTMWAYGQKLKAEHGGMAVGMSVWKQILAPGVDIRAVGYRIGVLSMLEMMLSSRLDPRGTNRKCVQGRCPDGFELAAGRRRSQRVPLQSGGISGGSAI